jgi:hypothetical protein
MNEWRMKLLLVALAGVMVVTTYATQCYSQVESCVCMVPGQCYSSCNPSGCNVPTCVIAVSYGYMNNVCPVTGSGTYTGRSVVVGDAAVCFISTCKIYNNCTHVYELPPCGCNYVMPRYVGTGGACQP